MVDYKTSALMIRYHIDILAISLPKLKGLYLFCHIC